MNIHNQSPERVNPADSTEMPIISQSVFDAWTLEWAKQVVNTEALWNFFSDDAGEMMKKIYFDDDTIQNLLSSVGVQNIYARFGIADEYKPYDITEPTFVIILFAVDTQGKKCSAYHVGMPQYDYTFGLNEQDPQNIGDFISDILARKWICGWKKIIECDKPVFPATLFTTDYGFLMGYNYLMSDFMYALYPPNSNIQNYDVVILLAAHEHTSYLSDDEQITISTFGLVVAGVQIQLTGIRSSSQAVNSYYDLSLPSPPNH